MTLASGARQDEKTLNGGERESRPLILIVQFLDDDHLKTQPRHKVRVTRRGRAEDSQAR